MRAKYRTQGIICFAALPFWIAGFIALYDHLAHVFERPTHYLVNITGIVGFAGAVFLIVYGIINLVKMGKVKK